MERGALWLVSAESAARKIGAWRCSNGFASVRLIATVGTEESRFRGTKYAQRRGTRGYVVRAREFEGGLVESADVRNSRESEGLGSAVTSERPFVPAALLRG